MSSIAQGAVSNNEETRNGQAQAKLTPELYARRILAFAKRSKSHSLYPGTHYSSLARLLFSPYQSFGEEGRVQIGDDSAEFIHLYDLDTKRQASKISIPSLKHLDEYDDETRRNQPSGRLLFMQGYLSPQWLNRIGSKFDVDPEFFFRHLDFAPLQRTPNHFFMVSLPSAAEVVRVRITSILRWEDFQFLPQHIVSDMRSACQIQMEEYLDNLVKGRRVSLSDSVVRKFSVHDKQYFTIEQMVTICVTRNPQGWIALIWLDHGRDLSLSLDGPWRFLQRQSRNQNSLTVLPTIQYRSRIALKREPNIPTAVEHPVAGPSRHGAPSLPQSAAHITSDYGRSLRPEVMECDAFYALDEIFRFAIASESQFLEMMKLKIKAATVVGGSGRIEDLEAALDLIEEHRQLIQENVETVRAGGHPKWPKAPEKIRRKAVVARERLEADYEYLLSYAERLSERCAEGISIMMNDALFRQSQRAIEQTEATMKLTLLAFCFAPLSFTTSFFSMHVTEINDRTFSIWSWFLASVVLLGISFCFWKWSPFSLLQHCWVVVSASLFHSS